MDYESTEDSGDDGKRDRQSLNGDSEKLSEREELLEEWFRHASLIERHENSVRSWNFRMRPVGFSAALGSMRIMQFFVCWHLVAGVSGVLITVLWVSNRALGIALIVGSLFAFGSFMSQVWAQAVTREREFIAKVRMEESLEEVREALKKEQELRRRILDEDF
ncbi:hypothetical protein [Lentzea sp. NBRC 102530]|uniref:hypothetical protein n=1 Tax=Lentzea sp. NBRC 102530 TaxID=3032201 RepID=UPI0024A4A763|nr:hypothetical protein [Lentzea sp. NBRC 102530]GLY51876.1 hypothetical protein Lesp01_55320 [Lentzea sp. NBRC 102530]